MMHVSLCCICSGVGNPCQQHEQDRGGGSLVALNPQADPRALILLHSCHVGRSGFPNWEVGLSDLAPCFIGTSGAFNKLFTVYS